MSEKISTQINFNDLVSFIKLHTASPKNLDLVEVSVPILITKLQEQQASFKADFEEEMAEYEKEMAVVQKLREKHVNNPKIEINEPYKPHIPNQIETIGRYIKMFESLTCETLNLTKSEILDFLNGSFKTPTQLQTGHNPLLNFSGSL